MVQLTVDDKLIEAKESTTLLATCLDNGIYIPNLCFLRVMKNPPASCRLCFVEIEGEGKPVSSCKLKVKEGMVVRTDTPAVRRLQLSAFQLLLSAHRLDPHCPANKKCDLWRIGRHLGVGIKQKRLERIQRQVPKAEYHPLLAYDPLRCVLCGRCVFICRKQHGYSLLTFAKRGFDTVISAYGYEDPTNLPCKDCRACVNICPVRAIYFREEYPKALASGE
jgi:NADH dehydrogenase/NADH:ubiquinone oxidoreductase subunit G